jgi:hypothetical protein
LDAASVLRSKYGATKIFLATDDPEVAKQCLGEATKAQGFTCDVAAGIDREVYAAGSDTEAGWLEERMGGAEKANRRAGLHPSHPLSATQMQNVPVGCFVDWELLSECGYFVGDLSRSFFRVPVLLHVSRRRQVPPVISIEATDGWLIA